MRTPDVFALVALATAGVISATGGGDLALDRQAVQIASGLDGLSGLGAKAVDAPSATSDNNFINFCKDQTLTDGLQITSGSCNGIVMGKIPSKAKMVSCIITKPTTGEQIPSGKDFTVSVRISNLQAGSFTNADAAYYAAPQDLNDQGIIIGHTHITIQDLGNSLNPSDPPDPARFAFFKGVDNGEDGQGAVSVNVVGGLPPGNYRVCTLSSASNHQPVIMPVAQRGAQDDCTKFIVTGNTNIRNNNANDGPGGITAAAVAQSAVQLGPGAVDSAGADAKNADANEDANAKANDDSDSKTASPKSVDKIKDAGQDLAVEAKTSNPTPPNPTLTDSNKDVGKKQAVVKSSKKDNTGTKDTDPDAAGLDSTDVKEKNKKAGVKKLDRNDKDKKENDKKENDKKENGKKENDKKENDKRENDKRENDKRENDKAEKYKKEKDKKEKDKKEKDKKEKDKKERDQKERDQKENDKKENDKQEKDNKKKDKEKDLNEIDKKEKNKKERDQKNKQKEEKQKKDKDKKDKDKKDKDKKDKDKKKIKEKDNSKDSNKDNTKDDRKNKENGKNVTVVAAKQADIQGIKAADPASTTNGRDEGQKAAAEAQRYWSGSKRGRRSRRHSRKVNP